MYRLGFPLGQCRHRNPGFHFRTAISPAGICQLRPLPLTPRPIKGEIFSSWMARVSAVNGLTVPELIEYACDASKRSEVMNVDRELMAGLSQLCRISEDRLSEFDLCAQLPCAPPWLLLPVVHKPPIDHTCSKIPIPSCYLCFWEYERDGTTPYWKTEWTLALVTRCSKHLVCLSEYCCHCLRGQLSMVAHPKQSGLVVRCTFCYKASASHARPDGAASRMRLIASIGQSLILACRGLDPDPMWLGPVDAATFLSVVDDLIWILVDGDLDNGLPLIDQYAPVTNAEAARLGRTPRYLPVSYLAARHREIIIAAVAVALLGSRLTEQFDLETRLPVPIDQLDAYPFSSVLRWSMRDKSSEIAERVGRWPPILKERALRYLPLVD